MPEFHRTGAAEIPASKMPGVGHDNIPEFTGKHLWIVTAAWTVNPATFTAGQSVFLDMENMLVLSSVGCFWCEQDYSLLISGKKCPGDASPGWRRT